MSVRWLPRVFDFEGSEPDPIPDDHPMRRVTREIAFGGTWTPELARQIGNLFDTLAPEWHTRDRPERLVPIVDALDRGGPFGDAWAVELGSGTGIATKTITARLRLLVAVDLSIEMLRLAPAVTPRIRADGARLPFQDGAVSTLLLVNMLLFPSEVDRVVEADGSVVWVSTVGRYTPIFLSPEEVDRALPGDWDTVAAEAGRGTWCVARRARPQ